MRNSPKLQSATDRATTRGAARRRRCLNRRRTAGNLFRTTTERVGGVKGHRTLVKFAWRVLNITH